LTEPTGIISAEWLAHVQELKKQIEELTCKGDGTNTYYVVYEWKNERQRGNGWIVTKTNVDLRKSIDLLTFIDDQKKQGNYQEYILLSWKLLDEEVLH